ncbi:FAD-dependent monooxygenase ctvC [Colletotrichum liriopes]|uniref:FAD-dependent monooxygenase ctvC n=1 Tax=Colletotrichum liriopes TaxID=708192 RepID=A0AA37LMZ7_9PEZI|nr:FAD-dependent monooxygenase ctvC [Colletotrichum liriopes]
MRMKEKYVGDAIPKFTSDDQAKMAKLHEYDLILPGVKFGDVHRRMIAGICTPLAEVVFKKWHSRRLMLIGDSAHKFEPLSGQGGNNAIETAAAFTNALNRVLKANPNRRLSSDEITEIFKSTQQVREPRVSRLVKTSHDQQNIEANQAPIQTAIASQFIKLLSEEAKLAQFDEVVLDAISLDMLPIPNRPRRIAWHDECHRRPVSRGWLTVFLVFIFLGISFIGVNLLWGAGFANGTFDLLDVTYRSGRHYNGDLAIQAFTGSGAIDEFFGPIVALFYPAATSSSTSPASLTMYYLLFTVFALVPLVLVEGYRRRSRLTLVACAGVWATVSVILGAGMAFPIFFAVECLSSHFSTHFIPTTRAIPKHVADYLFIGVILGYAVPTLSIFLVDDSVVKQLAILLFQFTSILIIGVVKACACLDGTAFQKQTDDQKEPLTIDDDTRDLPGLKNFYKRMLGAELFIQANVVVLCLSMVVWGSVAIFDVYRTGLSNVKPLEGIALFLVGSVLFGPGAASHALWAWRETLMAKTSFGRVNEV